MASVLALLDVIQAFTAAGAQAKFMNAMELTAYEAAETHKWNEAVEYSRQKID